MPCQSFQPMVSYLPDAGIKKPSGKPGTPVSQGKEIRAGEVYGRMVSFRLPDKHRGTLSDGRRYGKFRRTAEAPCDGTDGCVPFVLPPRCPASAIQPAEMVGNGRRDGTARAPRFKRKTVKAFSPTLGIAGESPTRRGTPKQSPAKTAFEHTLKKRRPDAPKFCPYDIYL